MTLRLPRTRWLALLPAGSVTPVPEFRFSFNVFRIDPVHTFIETCRRAEQWGYDAVFAADHLGIAAPFMTLVAAAAATDRMRVGTLVLNAPWWNPALLARDIATTDVLTGGRLEVGLGAGHMKWEYDQADIPFPSFTTRTARLRQTIEELASRFAEDGFAQQAELREAHNIAVLRPTQRRGFGGYGPPLLVGGTGDQVLRLAAQYADTVSIACLYQVKGRPQGTMRLATVAEIEQRVGYVRRCAGAARHPELHTLIQEVVLTDDRRKAAGMLAAKYGNLLTANEILQSPTLLIGTVEQIARQLRANRERYGFTHYTIPQPHVAAFAPVITVLGDLN